MELGRPNLLVVSFTVSGIFYIVPFPGMLSSGLLPYLPLLPKEYVVRDSTYSVTHVKVYYINHSPLIHIVSPLILNGSQFALDKLVSTFPDYILVLCTFGTGCQEGIVLR